MPGCERKHEVRVPPVCVLVSVRREELERQLAALLAAAKGHGDEDDYDEYDSDEEGEEGEEAGDRASVGDAAENDEYSDDAYDDDFDGGGDQGGGGGGGAATADKVCVRELCVALCLVAHRLKIYRCKHRFSRQRTCA